MILAATSSTDVATAFIEIGAVALVLAVLARVASRFGFTAIPLYLIAGLAVGEGGVFPLDVSHDFIELVAEIGVLLLLLTLGLEYSTVELRLGLRSGGAAGVVDAVANFSPGFALLDRGGDEPLLLAVIGLTLVVGGLAQRLEVSAAIGAFLVGLALSGPVQRRAGALIEPLRDLFAAVFFVFFSFQIDPVRLIDSLVPAVLLAVVAIGTKIGTGWFAAAKSGVGRAGRIRAGTALAARGEFSIVIASLGAGLADGERLGAVAAGFVLLTAVIGPLAARGADPLASALFSQRSSSG